MKNTAPAPQRRCSTCGEWKPELEFADKSHPSGFRGRCGECIRLERRATRPTPAVSRMLSAARSRAKSRGLPFTIEAGDISMPETCPVLHIPLATGERDNAPSLDRIVPRLGYVPGNVIVISQRANRIKNDATPQELYDIAEFFAAIERGAPPPRRT